jgi:hypothetical protein
MAKKTQTIRVRRKMLGGLVFLLGGLLFVGTGLQSNSWVFLAIGAIVVAVAVALLGLSRVTLGPDGLVQHAPLSPKANVRIPKAVIRQVHTAPWATVTQVIVDTTSGEVVLMGLSSYVKEQAVEYSETIAKWAGVPFDPSNYPDRGPKRRV